MLWRTRARAVGLIALFWAGASGVLGLGIALRLLITHRPAITADTIFDVLKYAGAWSGIGVVCGAGFSLALLVFARRPFIGKQYAIPVTASVASLAFLVGLLTDGSSVATGLAAVAAALAVTSLWVASRSNRVEHASAERAT
jgi:hypothetical protein